MRTTTVIWILVICVLSNASSITYAVVEDSGLATESPSFLGVQSESTESTNALSPESSAPRSSQVDSKLVARAAEELSSFQVAYFDYVRSMEGQLQPSFEKWAAANPGKVFPYDRWTTLRRQAHANFKAKYKKAIDLHDKYTATLKSGVLTSLAPSDSYLWVSKSEYLVELRSRSSGQTVAAFPIAYGSNPDGKEKAVDGDLRTPSTPANLRTPDKTPFFVGKKSPLAATGAMQSRWIGVDSKRAEDKFWSRGGGNIGFHGTSDADSMGTKASHACLRMLSRDAILLYDRVQVGTPLIIAD